MLIHLHLRTDPSSEPRRPSKSTLAKQARQQQLAAELVSAQSTARALNIGQQQHGRPFERGSERAIELQQSLSELWLAQQAYSSAMKEDDKGTWRQLRDKVGRLGDKTAAGGEKPPERKPITLADGSTLPSAMATGARRQRQGGTDPAGGRHVSFAADVWDAQQVATEPQASPPKVPTR